MYVICKYVHLHTQLDSEDSSSLQGDSGGESMTTTEESTLCRLAPEVAAEPPFCTENFDLEKTVVTLDSFSEKVSSISTMFYSGSSLGVHVMDDGIYHFLKFMTVGVTHGINLFMRRKLT